MNNFNFHLSWHDKTIIHADGRQNEGWLANMEAVDIAKEIRDIDYALITVNKLGWKRGDEEGGLLAKKIYMDMQNYMNNHPEYYGCSE